MAISKIKLPDNSVENIVDSRILGIDSVPTESSDNVVTSGGVYDSLVDTEEVVSAALNDLNNRIDAVTTPINITYADLVTLKTNSGLIPGKKYRITDYVTKVKSSYTATRSAEHAFDIIVTATSANTLDEEAKAALHSGDTYFANTNFDAWKIWYCLDNDTTRFDWIDSNCKGAIYRMIDEWDNDVPYDFKNAQFKRYKVTAKNDHQELSVLNGLYIGNPSNYSYGLQNDTSDYKWFYTFTRLGETWGDDIEDGSISGVGTFCNQFGIAIDKEETMVMNNVVFANGPVMTAFLLTQNPEPYNPLPDTICYNFYCETKLRYMTAMGGFAHVDVVGPFRRNTIVGGFRHIHIKTNCQDNTIVCFDDNSFNNLGDSFYNNSIVISGSFSNNSFDIYCHDNVIICGEQFCGNNCETYFYNNLLDCTGSVGYNTFENNCRNNSFYISSTGLTNNFFFATVSDNNFGTQETPMPRMTSCFIKRFSSNTLTGDLSNVHFNGQINNCVINSDMVGCVLDSILSYVTVPVKSGYRFASVDVKGNIRGASGSEIALDADQFYLSSVTTTNRRITIEGQSDGAIVATWQGSNGMEGVKKASGANTWVALSFSGAGTLNTTNTTSQTTNASESLSGTVNLHKIAKTGSYSDLLNTPAPTNWHPKIFYGTCSTAAATGEKAVTCPVFTSDDLGDGTILFVSFTYNNTAEPEDVKLNVNSTGAYQVRKVYNYASGNINNAGEIRGIVHQFICWKADEDDYRWYLVGVDYNTNTTYSAMTQAQLDAGTSTTGYRITPKLLRDNFYTEDEVDALIPSVPVTDVTVGGTSVVSNSVAEITLPTVPTISTNVQTDKASDTKTSSPKSVYDEVHPNVASSQPQGGFTPNIFYDLSTISGSVTFALATPTDANIVNHYYWTFDTGSTAPTITWPSGISWYGGSAPTISASKHYEVSIIDNIAICMEV